MFQAKASESSNVSSKSSKHLNNLSSSEREFFSICRKNGAVWNSELLKKKQELEEAEALEQLFEAKGQRELAESNIVGQSELASKWMWTDKHK